MWPKSLPERIRAHGERVNSRSFDRGAFLRHYKTLVTAAMHPDAAVLHLGAGRGAIDNRWRLFRDNPSHRGPLIALDLDAAELRRNPLRWRVQADAEALPFAGESLDAIVCEYVFEHLVNPRKVLTECHRVLRTNGTIVFATPNKWSYISIIARLSPMRFHYLIARFRGTPPEVMYDTYYRLNTIAEISEAAGEGRFRVTGLRTFVGEPNYTVFLPGVHYLFVALHKLLERLPGLSTFCLDIVGMLVKE